MRRIPGLPVLVLLLAAAWCVPVHAEEAVQFSFGHRPGEQYRIEGVNRREVFVDGNAAGVSEVLTRIAVRMEEEEIVHARYRVSEESVGGDLFQVEREYEVRFEQSPQGEQTVPRSSFVPQVRDVPVFPEQPVLPGETWTRPGLEVHDFREMLGLDEPLRIPVKVDYEFVGLVEFEGEDYAELKLRYNLFHRPRTGDPEAEEIRLMTARFSQRLLWEVVAGRPHYYEENYDFFIQFTEGTRVEYRGTADGRVVGAPVLDRDRTREDIERSLQEETLDDTTVRSDEQGVTIALENIRFAPDSADLLESELEKLEWLARVLRNYPDRDLIITGHTALAGTEEGRQRLSEERAATVGQYLIDAGVRSRDGFMYQGRGAREPIAPNDTEEGRRRNRRVEITIMEN
jgi:outer membrane protein OmpA-like peptidoglycan-associated protein